MTFTSMTFLFVFLPITLLFYFAVPNKIKKYVLLVSSLIFYVWLGPLYFIYIFISIIINFFIMNLMHKYKSDKSKCKFLFVAFLFFNLVFYFISCNLSVQIEFLNNAYKFNLTLPAKVVKYSLSFYTLSVISYAVDVYCGRIEHTKSFSNFLIYTLMFGKVLAGPVTPYYEVMKNVNNPRITYDRCADGVSYFIKGLTKIVLLANHLLLIWKTVIADLSKMSVLSAWLGIIAFTYLMYFYLSGYSDMAVGIGKMMGIRFRKNFDHPFISQSISEFTGRWHISLLRWFNEYIYIPLGGLNKSVSFSIFNLLVTFMLFGIFHGGTVTFAIYGLYLGAIVILEKLIILKWLEKCPNFIRNIYSMLLIIIGFTILQAGDLNSLGLYFKALLGLNGNAFYDKQFLNLIVSNAVLVIVSIISATPYFSNIALKSTLKNPKTTPVIKTVVEFLFFGLTICYLVSAF